MPRTRVLILFLFGSFFCNAQEAKPKDGYISHKLMGHTYQEKIRDSVEYTCFRMRKVHRYKSTLSTIYSGTTETSRGKWKLKNDTLVLTEKWYRKYSNGVSAKKIRTAENVSRKRITKLVFVKYKWVEMVPYTNRYSAAYFPVKRIGFLKILLHPGHHNHDALKQETILKSIKND